jgi:hypothetical protein
MRGERGTPAATVAHAHACRYVRKEAEETVERLRQVQRRDMGLPFVAGVIDSPATEGLHPASGNVPQGPPPGNAAAVAAYVAANSAMDASSPRRSAAYRTGDAGGDMTQLDLQ